MTLGFSNENKTARKDEQNGEMAESVDVAQSSLGMALYFKANGVR